MRENKHEDGFALIAMVVAIFLVLLVLGVAAPKVAQDLRRDREVEAKHRGEQYVRAVRLYYRKLGHYPTSIDQLNKTNNIRFLRQAYIDPMTGKPDWRLIHVGENKTTVKGFFGEPLSGLATTGLGSLQGNLSPGIGTTPAAGAPGGAAGGSAFGSSSGSAFGGAGGGLGASNGAGAGTAAGAGGAGAGTGTGAGTGSANGVADQSASTFNGSGGGLIIGVGTGASGSSILDLNDQTTYETWEFIYDPRIEQLYAKATLLGGVPTTSGGSSGSSTSGFGGGTNSPAGSAPGAGSPGSSPSAPTVGAPVLP